MNKATIIETSYVNAMTQISVGKDTRKSSDHMTVNDWDTPFVLTPEGYLKAFSPKIRWLRKWHTIMVKLDPRDEALWNVWSVTLRDIAKGQALRQISDKISSFRLMRSINYLLAIGYLVRAEKDGGGE